MEMHFGLSMAEVLTGCVEQLPADELSSLQSRLLKGEPVQYVLGCAEFFGRRFHVAPGVLIPRPETEELCRWILDDDRRDRHHDSILDIGTGSGCIACTLAAELPHAEVSAWDIAEKALSIAADNAQQTGVHVNFSRVDILRPVPPLEVWSTIVSNPPYICQKEQLDMAPHVLQHEPHQALFVPDDAPLLFYRAIASYAWQALKDDGRLFFELNPLYADDVANMLNAMGFTHTVIRKDQFDKERFIKTCK